jgi:hypothetical protein
VATRQRIAKFFALDATEHGHVTTPVGHCFFST